ncbi:enhancer of polycomb-like protein 2-like [Iris pallida]|uniref:Enhancer of polycomb-like protein 2-like n=1 Tax=Iris pallida TaxID=29817 RepID=A0AAX6I418_IRIPA|nr:enhancer of polycomb-like protein 2-like [Iris pallida]
MITIVIDLSSTSSSEIIVLLRLNQITRRSMVDFDRVVWDLLLPSNCTDPFVFDPWKSVLDQLDLSPSAHRDFYFSITNHPEQGKLEALLFKLEVLDHKTRERAGIIPNFGLPIPVHLLLDAAAEELHRK